MHRSVLLLAMCVGLSACGTSTTPVATTGGDRHVQNLCWGCNPIPMPGRPAYPAYPVEPPAYQPPVAEPTAAPEMPGGGGGGEENPPPVQPDQTATVVVKDFEFVPQRVVIAPGTTVTWKFEGPAHPHTSTSDASSSLPWDSGKKEVGTTFSMKFDTQGAFSYHCELHPQMHGTVIVTPEGSGGGGDEGEDQGGGDAGGGEAGGGDTGGGDTGGGGGGGY